jgi:hypothetical protein
LQEQNKYDQMPSDLLDRLQRILFFADKVADDIVGEETEILEKTIPEMFEVMQKVATLRASMSSVGVSVGNPLFWICQVLMIAERMVGGLVRLGEDRRNGQRAGQGDRRIRACSER